MRIVSVQRFAIALVVLGSTAAIALGVASAGGKGAPRGSGAASAPLPGLTGNVARFRSQTGQDSIVNQAFLNWGQGLSWGAPFAVLFPTLAPIPMIHLGTAGRNRLETITPTGLASGQGDGYLIALNQAIAAWGKAIYVRPIAEMNNSRNLWSGYTPNGRPKDASHSPATYRKAFARIYLILHGGPASEINAKLRQLGLPPLRGGGLLLNPFPRLRVVWSPLAGGTPRVPGNAPESYYPGTMFVDVEGGDIYDEGLTDNAPWPDLEALYRLALGHRKPFSVPEWGLFSIDDPAFVQHMCAFVVTHRATEMQAFYESKPGSIFDLEPKPKSRQADRKCMTPLAGGLPAWAAANAPGSGPKVIALKLTPSPAAGPTPLAVQFSIVASLNVPIVEWQLLFGDGAQTGGAGPPPATVQHGYVQDGIDEATLIVYQSPPFTPEAARFLTSASVKVGTGATPLVSFKATPTAGAVQLAVTLQTDLNLSVAVTSWKIVLGDGNTLQGSGRPPHFTGHTYATAGTYRVLLVVNGAQGTRFIAQANITLAGGKPPPASGTPTGRVLVNGKLFTGGPVPYNSRIDVTNGTLQIKTDTGSVLVYGAGVPAAFVLLRGADGGRPIVELRLTGGDFGACKRTTSVRSAAPSKTVRRLWGRAKGRFRTRGRYAAATVRGTLWLTADRCDGTLTQVKQGRVQVFDFVLKKKVLVVAGRSYLAKKP